MAWKEIPRLVVGDLIDSAWMNTYVRDNLNAIGVNAHTGAGGDGSAILASVNHVDLDEQGALSEPAAGHVRFATNTDGTLRFRANGGSELTVSNTTHTHS